MAKASATKMTTSRSDQSEQLERFKQAARELGCDESEERFDEALRKVAGHRPSPRAENSRKVGPKGSRNAE